MKKTDKELLEFFGLKVGDKVKIEGFINPFVIFEDGGIRYFEEMGKKGIPCNSRDIIDPIHKLLGNYYYYEIITPKKKVGEMKCDEMLCRKCPLRAIHCNAKGKTLYEALENYEKDLSHKKSIPIFSVPLKPFEKALIGALKAELEKDVEVE